MEFKTDKIKKNQSWLREYWAMYKLQWTTDYSVQRFFVACVGITKPIKQSYSEELFYKINLEDKGLYKETHLVNAWESAWQEILLK